MNDKPKEEIRLVNGSTLVSRYVPGVGTVWTPKERRFVLNRAMRRKQAALDRKKA